MKKVPLQTPAIPELKFLQHVFSIVDDPEGVVALGRALSSPERLHILSLLTANSYTISEIARQMYMSVSTAAFHLRLLQAARLIEIVQMPVKRGSVQLCQINVSSLRVQINPLEQKQPASDLFVQNIPVGLYTGADLRFISGFCTATEQIMFDDGNYFDSRRIGAQILWASRGYVEYTVSNIHPGRHIRRIELSLEICSETMNYQLGWKSDITFWLNGHELCTFTSPSDFGGRRGLLNPDWWNDSSTQYGELKTVTVTPDGVSFCGMPVEGTRSVDPALFSSDSTFVFRIGNKPGARYEGGFNIFGRGFGDIPQDIRVTVEYDPD